MPTDLPPDYVPKPPQDPDSPPTPGAPGSVAPGKGCDVVDPTGWEAPPVLPGDVPLGVPTPAGTPTF